MRSSRANPALPKHLTICLEMDPDQNLAYFYRGIASSRLGRSDPAIQDLEEALRRNPNVWEIYLWLAHEFDKQQEYEWAVSVLDQGIAIHGENGHLVFHRGRSLYSNGDFESAIRDFDRAIEHSCEVAKTLFGRARAFEQLRDYAAAIADFSAALEQSSDNFETLVARGEAYLDNDEPGSAIEDLSRAIELNSTKAHPFVIRGQAWWMSGDEVKARRDFDCALQLEPTFRIALPCSEKLLFMFPIKVLAGDPMFSRQQMMNWRGGFRQCKPRCLPDARRVRLNPTIEVVRGAERRWFNDPMFIVDELSFSASLRWSCCGRLTTNWQTLDLPGEHWYWRGDLPDHNHTTPRG